MPAKDTSLELVVVPCRTDNYAYLVHNATTGETALIDAPAATPIQAVLQARGWTLSDILITHHHGDHVEGVEELRSGARVIGAAADAHRLPDLDVAVKEGDMLPVCGVNTIVLDVSGHTLGHVAYHMPAPKFAFTADSLMALGCGRLFEGSASQMWTSLQKLRQLPKDTNICSGHEYTLANGQFALTIDPNNRALISRLEQVKAARQVNEPTVPALLEEEMRTNPFLRADDPALKTALGMSDSSDVNVFAEIRARKDKF